MIGIDTSVVVRYLVGTPPEQADRARQLIDSDREIGVSLLVLAETAHVLRSFYRVPRPEILDRLLELISRANLNPLELSKADTIDALVRARSFASSPVTDALIAAVARASGAVPVYTFDERFGRLGAAVAAP